MPLLSPCYLRTVFLNFGTKADLAARLFRVLALDGDEQDVELRDMLHEFDRGTVGQSAAEANETGVAVANVFDLKHDGLSEGGEIAACLQILRQVALKFVEHPHECFIEFFRFFFTVGSCAQKRAFRLQ